MKVHSFIMPPCWGKLFSVPPILVNLISQDRLEEIFGTNIHFIQGWRFWWSKVNMAIPFLSTCLRNNLRRLLQICPKHIHLHSNWINWLDFGLYGSKVKANVARRCPMLMNDLQWACTDMQVSWNYACAQRRGNSSVMKKTKTNFEQNLQIIAPTTGLYI